jgi:hypothetical protein
MRKLDDLKEAVRRLDSEELSEFRSWFLRFETDSWDRRIENDAMSGRLDRLAEEALQDLREGRTQPL